MLKLKGQAESGEWVEFQVNNIVDAFEDEIKVLLEREVWIDADTVQPSDDPRSWWKPDVCPITGMPFFMWLEHPDVGWVPTYGGPFDSWTIPERDDNGQLFNMRFGHDAGAWEDGAESADDPRKAMLDEIRWKLLAQPKYETESGDAISTYDLDLILDEMEAKL